MKFNCNIEIEGVTTKDEFISVLQMVLGSYADINESYPDFHEVTIDINE